MLAEKYMSDFRIGEFKLVYQGRKKDYLEESSWKREGFLPFGEEIPDDADNPRGEVENDNIDDYSDEYGDADEYDDNDGYSDEYGDIDEYDNTDENNATEGSVSGFVLIEDGIDEELPFAYDVPSEHAEFESQKKRETSSEGDYDHTKEEEVYGMLHMPEHPGQNEPWLEILLYTAAEDSTITGGNYVGRYHVPTLYIALLKFVFDPRSILHSFVEIYGEKIYPEIKDGVSMEISPANWIGYACKVWEDSDECRDLRQRFEKYGMEYMDFDELLERSRVFARECYDRILQLSTPAGATRRPHPQWTGPFWRRRISCWPYDMRILLRRHLEGRW